MFYCLSVQCTRGAMQILMPVANTRNVIAFVIWWCWLAEWLGRFGRVGWAELSWVGWLANTTKCSEPTNRNIYLFVIVFTERLAHFQSEICVYQVNGKQISIAWRKRGKKRVRGTYTNNERTQKGEWDRHNECEFYENSFFSQPNTNARATETHTHKKCGNLYRMLGGQTFMNVFFLWMWSSNTVEAHVSHRLRYKSDDISDRWFEASFFQWALHHGWETMQEKDSWIG